MNKANHDGYSLIDGKYTLPQSMVNACTLDYIDMVKDCIAEGIRVDTKLTENTTVVRLVRGVNIVGEGHSIRNAHEKEEPYVGLVVAMYRAKKLLLPSYLPFAEYSNTLYAKLLLKRMEELILSGNRRGTIKYRRVESTTHAIVDYQYKGINIHIGSAALASGDVDNTYVGKLVALAKATGEDIPEVFSNHRSLSNRVKSIVVGTPIVGARLEDMPATKMNEAAFIHRTSVDGLVDWEVDVLLQNPSTKGLLSHIKR